MKYDYEIKVGRILKDGTKIWVIVWHLPNGKTEKDFGGDDKAFLSEAHAEAVIPFYTNAGKRI